MASKVDQLLSAFESVVGEPWMGALSGQERVWFLVYDPAELRKVDLRAGDFETATLRAGKKWISVSMKSCFPAWMARHEYRDEYFADPEVLVDQLEMDFKQEAVRYLAQQIQAADESTLVALRDVSALFGFVRLNEVLRGATSSFKGRMLVFFPGEFQQNQYRLLDARDGWSYLARPIIA
ncbi:MAG: hypothetical protein RL742_1259 [Bacteroidota bacterium]|jgi:hypothetical protein